MSRDPDKGKVYEAERIAFDLGTMADHLREPSLIAETEQVLDSLWWQHQRLPRVDVGGARVDMTTYGGRATRHWIRYSAGGCERYTVSHELAHVVAKNRSLCDAHGPSFRAVHVRVVEAVYGAEYAHELARTYNDAGIPADMDVLAGKVHVAPARPIIPIDIITGPLRGGWSPPSAATL